MPPSLTRKLLAIAAFVAIGLDRGFAADPIAAGPISAGPIAADTPAVAANKIDSMLLASMQSRAIQPAAVAGDAEFHRRAWLDLAGVAPPVWRARSFLADDDSAKRKKLIGSLIASPRHADHLASRWIDVLLPADSQADFARRDQVTALRAWLRRQFLEATPYDHFVGSFLTAGGAADSGPAIFYTANDLQPEKLAAATSRIFLGIQIQCAQCHDHPFDRWTQEDFWSYAAFFSQLKSSDPTAGQRSFLEDRVGGEVTLPETETIVPPRYPGVSSPPERDPAGLRRRQLTIWLASRDNPFFARAAVNRAWGHLFGRGLVDPVDAMDADHKPSHPSVLDYLSDQFTRHRFDLGWLYETLATTDAYSRTSKFDDGPRPPADAFAVMAVKTLSAEQFYDSLRQNVFHRTGDNDPFREAFLARMRAPNASPVDYPSGVVQSLAMLNGTETTLATSQYGGGQPSGGQPTEGLLAALEAPFFDDGDVVDTLFLATLSRLPTQSERSRFDAHLQSGQSVTDRPGLIGDLIWVLINTAECTVCP